MDSGSGSNQQQRYCPTPIMAPPSVATSPPIMSGGNIMTTIHQQTHHPPPSISPHPGPYYGHHTAGTSHYPTPSPTPPPPPMHHQQYYAHTHSYYAHGSHQQAQQQQQQQQPQQSQHHGIANTHVPINTAPGTAQSTSQHSHLMSHGSYHHPQSQTHHQQWAPSTHPHQQQPHHYYHQPAHHPPSQQQQQPTQQHGYPPPPHSPYSYVQSHVPPPTPPPSHTPHSSQQHLQQAVQPQQHQHPPQVSVSPGPVQMHQTPPQQQPQSHALMNLSRFVSQQSPSPSPRASPSLAPSHHSQQMPQMGPTSPSPFSGHMEHHPGINGHTSNVGVNNNPVMSPPPAPIHTQQPMSPPSPVSTPQHSLIGPPQLPYNVNGGEMLDRCSPTKINALGSGDEHDNTIGHTINKTDSSSNSNSKGRDLPSVFSNITPSKIASIMNCDLKKVNASPVNVTKPSNLNSNYSQNNNSSMLANNDDNFVSEGGYPGGSSSSVTSTDALETQEILKDMCDSVPTTPIPNGGKGTSCSPSSKPIGSPSSSGNGHQMMPVRLQNMHKGARTKANMKKLMQEQQITPNGQVVDANSELVVNNAKDDELMDSVTPKPTPEKPVKSPKKRKTQPKDTSTPVLPNNSLLPMSPINMDLTADSSISATPVIRPGYTKSGKKIGRPRKDATQAGQPAAVKPKKKREVKSTPKKSKKGAQIELAELPAEAESFDNVQLMESEIVTAPIVNESTHKIKRKTVKASRKRPSKTKVRNDVSVVEELPVETESDLATPPFPQEEGMRPVETPCNELSPMKKVSKKRGKKNVVTNINISTDSSPDSTVLSTIPGSKISEQEAESVALRVQSSPITIKGKRKGKKSVVASPVDTPEPAVSTARRTKIGSTEKRSPVRSVPKDVTISISPERSELPRLRSRSPKQRESPPLRISSPRAAKERSSTPGSSTNQSSTTTSRYRTSKEKEVDGTVTTPLSSPSIRIPKKTPEKDKETLGIRSSSRQKANETNHMEVPEAPKDLISLPLVKRSRQLSKESLDSIDIPKKGRRKALSNEIRLSSDSDRSPSFISKRVSRRKSGSVTGSVDNLSSPSFNHTSSSLSLIPSEGSLELPSDFSAISTSSFVEQHLVSPPVLPAPTVSNKRRKTKKAGKAKSKSRRVSLENVPELLTVSAGPSESIPVENQTDSSHLVEPEDVLVTGKGRRPRKLSTKKGKRRASAAAAVTTSLDSSLGQGEINDDHSVQLSGKKASPTKPTKKVTGRPRKQKQLSKPGVLNIPVPAILGLTKKNVKFKTEEKAQKLTKKITVKVAEPLDVDHSSSTYPEFKADTTVENVGDGQFQDTASTKRRRYSVTSATNTQVSAKLNFEQESELQKLKSSPAASHSGNSPSNTPKALRRDSRSVSRDYDVSVVLTDIVQTFTAGDSSLLGISTSFSRLQSPASTFVPSHSLESPIERNSSGSRMNDEMSTSSASLLEMPKLKKRKQQGDSDSVDSQSKKKLAAIVQPNPELQARKANLEAEIAMMLLELKTGTSSKSPSPAKSISNADVQDTISKKKTKSRKRKHSRSSRRSIDVSAEVEESVPEIPGLDFSVPPANIDSLATTTPAPKGTKRKGSKGRRSSNAKKAKAASSSFLSLKGESMAGLPEAPSDNIPLPTMPVKVARTVAIPTASSLGLDSPVVVTKSKKREKKNTPIRLKTPKVIIRSPDIVTITMAPSSTTSTAQPSTSKATSAITTTVASSSLPLSSSTLMTSTSLLETSTSSLLNQSAPLTLKHKRKQSKKQLKLSLESSNQSTNGIAVTPVMESAENVEVVPKKKRQKKMRGSVEPVHVADAVPSTSTAALAMVPVSSTSKLFPYQISPKPYKKPTVFCKSTSFIDTATAKDDDNQKKKALDAPALKVVGGLTKFYRGGEIEEVDQDPKLPKEKAQLQTDNAVPWICSFCHLGPHSQKLGDLFGPYFADLPSIHGKPSSKRETWMHGDCALWAGSLLLIGTYLRRLEETLQDADQETCMACGRNGATIGCLRRGCKKTVHYPCAVRRFWKMDEQNFHSYCPQHIP